MTDTTEWIPQAACVGDDMDDWFQERSVTVDAIAATLQARRVCERCPVREACLDRALDEEGACGVDSRHGIRGGLDGRERHNLSRRRARAALAATAPH
ncbi:WhiB family transcriptional regulator [Streptomyces sp. IB2014 016-6]|uniref:WhiB family transcriptional regulator n=1 Tax=Streptomyces sp. IB2014 016-6 TaxID=2517818 RepID=UPI0011CAAF89|nr:WhiB family transcriptional regulator [Streptomyces sp. IB2014 016-6]TXL91627.1 WhiB family transcriptional regulator [Streptomyces sp. IB2014 016-6]